MTTEWGLTEAQSRVLSGEGQEGCPLCEEALASFHHLHGQSTRIARIRRGQWVRIPSAWRGQVTRRQTINKRQSKHPKKQRTNNMGERKSLSERSAPTIEEYE